ALLYSAFVSRADGHMRQMNASLVDAVILKTVLLGGASIHTELADYILHKPRAKTCLILAEVQLLKVISQHTLQAERQNQLQMKDYQMYSRVKHIYRKLVRLSLNR